MQTKPSRMQHRSVVCGVIVAMLVALPLAAANARWIEKGNPRCPYGVYLEGLQGTVVLSMILDRSGHVTDTRVMRSSGSKTLDQLAQEAAMKWRLSQDSLVATDLTQGRVEKISFVHPPPPVKSLLPQSQPYWAFTSYSRDH